MSYLPALGPTPAVAYALTHTAERYARHDDEPERVSRCAPVHCDLPAPYPVLRRRSEVD